MLETDTIRTANVRKHNFFMGERFKLSTFIFPEREIRSFGGQFIYFNSLLMQIKKLYQFYQSDFGKYTNPSGISDKSETAVHMYFLLPCFLQAGPFVIHIFFRAPPESRDFYSEL